MEWLEADGLRGSAMGTAGGLRTRRHHGVLLTATAPPAGRVMLANGFEAWLEASAGRIPLSSQRCVPGIVHPDAAGARSSFTPSPSPRWTFALPDGSTIDHELFVVKGAPLAALSWRHSKPEDG